MKDDTSYDTIQIIKKYKDKINYQNIDGTTPLMLACKEGHEDLVEAFIKYGADIELKDNKRNTAWDYANKSKNSEKIFSILDKYDDIKKPTYNPKRLVELLSSFTRDTPIKYTTHLWDFGDIKKEFGGFNNFIKEVENHWKTKLKDELFELSPNIHKKIENFLKKWKTTDDLKEWCNKGKDPFDFKEFSSYIEGFKQEIEIRTENNMLENIILDIEEHFNTSHEIEYKGLKGKQFYTDTEKFKLVLKKIFLEITKREKFTDIMVEAYDITGEYIDLTITHINSFSSKSASDMLKESNDGDFSDIKKSLSNLCDWSIENSFEDKHYRINYLACENGINEIEFLNERSKGFTHKMRFYK